jgi:hypothetical protein
MIPTPQPKRAGARKRATLFWEGRHLWRVWLSTGRRVYQGSVIREHYKRTWSAWRRGEFMGNYSSEDDARAVLEANAREEECQ